MSARVRSGAAPSVAASAAAPPVEEARIARRRSRGAVLVLVVFALVASIGLVLTATRAAAVFREITETGRPGYLQLALDSETPLWAELAPGESMRWLVEATLADAPSGELSLELEVRDAAPQAAEVVAQITACTGEIELVDAHLASCRGAEQIVLEAMPLGQLMPRSPRYELPRLVAGEPRQLLVTLALPDSAASGSGETLVELGLGVHAEGGETASPPPGSPPGPPRLPVTGGDVVALGLLGAGLAGLAAGVALLRAGRRRAGGAS